SSTHPKFAINLDDCLLCHSDSGQKPLKPEHLEREANTCLICHKSEVVSTLMKPIKTSLTFILPEKLFPNSSSLVPFIVKVRDEYNDPVELANVEFQMDMIFGKRFMGNASTNSVGLATLNYRVKDEGTFNVEAVFKGDENYVGTSNITDITVVSETSYGEYQSGIQLSIYYPSLLIVFLVISMFIIYGYITFQLIGVYKEKDKQKNC
ncbi:Ig-like domain-containing protein, partial [Thermoproteota archaeon]